MRIRLLLSSCFVGLASLAMIAPATAGAESFPDKASGYVSDHTAFFVGALLVAILVLLLVVNISQRRAKEKEAKGGAPKPGAAPHRRRSATPIRRRACARCRGPGRPCPHAARGSAWRRAHRPPRPACRRRCRRQCLAPPPAAPPAARIPRTAAAGCARSSGQAQRDPPAAARGDPAPQGGARRQTRQRRPAAGRRGSRRARAGAGARRCAGTGTAPQRWSEPKQKTFFGIKYGGGKQKREAALAEQRLAAARAARERELAQAGAGPATGAVRGAGAASRRRHSSRPGRSRR